MTRTAIALGLCMAFASGGCSTLRPALDQANHTAALLAEFEIQMKGFALTHELASKSRLRSIAKQEADIQFVVGAAAVDEAVRRANGDLAPARLQERLIAVAGAIGQGDEKSRSAVASIDAELAALLKPLPSTGDKIAVAQKAMSELGTESPRSVRITELVSFFKVVKDAAETNKTKIDDALAAANKVEKE